MSAHATRGARAAGVAVVIFVVLLQASTQYLSGHEASRILGHMTFVLVELPTIIIALTITYAALKRRQVSAVTAVGTTFLVAGALGAGFGVVLAALSLHFPTLMLRPVANISFARGAFYGFSHSVFHMGLWALAFAYPVSIDEARFKAVEADRLRSAAELAQLRAHLQPHFLLNTLNTIAGLVTEDPREARHIIGCLGDLLRDALKDDDELQSLNAQIEWLRRYAAILLARHPGELAFEWDIASDTMSVLLPRLLLQPLVENAVHHGALRRAGGGRVTVRSRWQDDGALECVIADNGPGLPRSPTRPGAFGLRSVVRRLELKYPGAKMSLDAADGTSGSGVRAVVTIPRSLLDREGCGA
jgi:signal transduction histidine kinase